MENIILTNNKDLRLVSVKVGVLSTLRFELPLVSASATHVEVIVTSGDVHSAYAATFIDATKRWQCDIAASQFPTVGKQSYEIAYVLDGKQFWDGKGWIEIEDATTSGIEPQPRPEPYRYAVVSVNGYGADAQGAVRIPKTFIATDSPVTTEGYMEGDIYFNRETGATWTLCNVQGTLTWVAVEGVITFDDNVTRTSANGVKSSGIWSALWGALASLPTGFSSLYDWCVSQLAGKASTADATLTERGFSAWVWEGTPPTYKGEAVVLRLEPYPFSPDDIGRCWVAFTESGEFCGLLGDPDARDDDNTRTEVTVEILDDSHSHHTATRTVLSGYRLGPDAQTNPNRDKPLASEAEAEALRTGKADRAANPTAGNLAALDANGNPTDSTIPAANVALKAEVASADTKAEQALANAAIAQNAADEANSRATVALETIPYALVAKTIENGAVSLDNRASNSVTVSATLSPNTLTINFPTAPSGKVRDFAMRLNIAAGVTAPEIAWPQGVTLENNGGEVPEIADGGTGGSSTILYFSESENNGTTAKFTVKGETLTAIAQA